MQPVLSCLAIRNHSYGRPEASSGGQLILVHIIWGAVGGNWERWKRACTLCTPENDPQPALWRTILSSLKDFEMGLIAARKKTCQIMLTE